MDTKQLEESLKPFQKACADKGKPISRLCFEEAYPGDSSTSYIVKVIAPWVGEMSRRAAITFLFETLFETTPQEVRKKVFAIIVRDDKEQSHSYEEQTSMNIKQLEESLKPFQKACADKGKPISRLCFEEAYPGDSSTSFLVKVGEPWVGEMGCTEALTFLFETLFEITPQEVRKKIFTIIVRDSKEQFHDYEETQTTLQH